MPPLQGTPANIRINLILPETGVFGLHSAGDSVRLSVPPWVKIAATELRRLVDQYGHHAMVPSHLPVVSLDSAIRIFCRWPIAAVDNRLRQIIIYRMFRRRRMAGAEAGSRGDERGARPD